MTLTERIENMAIEAMMGIDVNQRDALSLVDEAKREGVETEEFENLMFNTGDEGETNLKELVDKIECAGYTVEKISDSELILDKGYIGIVLH